MFLNRLKGYKDGEGSRKEDILGVAEISWFVQPGGN